MQRKRQDDASDKCTEASNNRPGAGFKTCGLHLVQGLTGKGAGPAVRLTSDGHYPRKQELNRAESTRSVIISSPALRVPGPPGARAGSTHTSFIDKLNRGRQHPSRFGGNWKRTQRRRHLPVVSRPLAG